jgi:signal transduction histidine kinase
MPGRGRRSASSSWSGSTPAGAYTGGRATFVATALAAALWILVTASDPDGIYLGGLVFFGIVVWAPFVVGRLIRARRQRETLLEDRAVVLEREREERARAAVAEERTRIARELHDVVAHAISVIILQGRGGRRLLHDDPDEARRAFDTIERTASQALAEMRKLLGMLRADDELLALAPQPSLSGLDALAREVTNAGLPVELRIHGEPVELPAGVDLSAYRIVQEALTNALKHAGPARANVSVRYGDGELEIEVVDDGSAAGNGDGTGHGLLGIRERVNVYGGSFEAGHRTVGGYAVRARLPYGN